MKGYFKFICLLVFCSCTSHPNNNLEETAAKFERAWQSDSTILVLKIRSEIAIESPKSEYGLYCKAWLLAQKGEPAKAMKTVDSLVTGFPSFVKGLYLRANLRSDQNDPDGAIRDFDLCVKKNPVFFEAYINRGGMYFKTDHPEMALKDFEMANQLQPFNKMVLMNLGHANIALGRRAEACAFWHKSDSLGEIQSSLLIAKYCNSKP